MLRGSILVNGVEISTEAVAAESQHHPAANPQDAQQAAARALVVRELLLQEANRSELIPEPKADSQGNVETDDEALVRQLLEQVIDIPDANDTECRRYYDQHLERFQSPDRYEPRHILLSADPKDEKAYAAAVSKAENLIAQLQESPDQFEDCARKHSDCESAKDGGDLGEVIQGQTSDAVDRCLVQLEEGELHSQPIEAPYGVHVLQLIRKTSGQTLRFDAVQGKIAEYLEESSWRQAITQYIEMLFGQAAIEGTTYQELMDD
ncbi:MAG: peptidylprolyl isomerase [Acidiferrobacterales bacterium]|nr:peptidylprolyl isomerase [Acidiferrobacterales bacterium]